jgi:hypothetical protein
MPMSSSQLISRISVCRKQSTHLSSLHRHISSLPPRELSSEDFKNLKQLIYKFVGKTAVRDNIWRQTKSLRGEEKVLAKAIQKHRNGRALSAEQTAFASEPGFDSLHEDDSDSRDSDPWAGTFVEVRR